MRRGVREDLGHDFAGYSPWSSRSSEPEPTQLADYLRHARYERGVPGGGSDVHRHEHVIKRVDVRLGRFVPVLGGPGLDDARQGEERGDMGRLAMPIGPRASAMVTSTPNCAKASTKAPIGAREPWSTRVPAQSKITALRCFMVLLPGCADVLIRRLLDCRSLTSTSARGRPCTWQLYPIQLCPIVVLPPW